MSESELPPAELRGLFEAERAAPHVNASDRVALRARLAASVAEWNRSAGSELDRKQPDQRVPLPVQEAPIDELRRAKGRRDEMVQATAQEPVAAPPASGRVRGKMNIFDKRVIGAATLTAAALGLLGVTIYKRRADAPSSQRHALDRFDGPAVALGRSFAMAPQAPPVAPTAGADLAITAGESVWIHVPFGSVDVEIQSKCNAEVEMSVVTGLLNQHGARPGDPPTMSTELQGGIIVGTDSSDGRSTKYHFTPGLDPGDGMYEYTSRCTGQPPIRGRLVIDRVNPNEPIGPSTNARVYNRVIVNEDNSVFQTPFDKLLAKLPDLVASIHAKSVFVLDDKLSVVPGGYLSQRSEKEGIAFRDWFEKEVAPRLDRARPNVPTRENGTWGDKDYVFSFMKKQSDERTYYVVIEDDTAGHAIHVFGEVSPGARVSIGAKTVWLGPADSASNALPLYKFAADVPVPPDQLVAAVRVDDTKGTHFYLLQASRLNVVDSCATTMTAPKQAAEKLDGQGDYTGALRALEAAMAACKPDRDTLSLALGYACKAGDAEAARSYWRRLPPELQRTHEPACALHQITREALDK